MGGEPGFHVNGIPRVQASVPACENVHVMFELGHFLQGYSALRATARLTPNRMSTMLTPRTMCPSPAMPEIAASMP